MPSGGDDDARAVAEDVERDEAEDEKMTELVLLEVAVELSLIHI